MILSPEKSGLGDEEQIERRDDLANVGDAWETVERRVSARREVEGEQRVVGQTVSLFEPERVSFRRTFATRVCPHGRPCVSVAGDDQFAGGGVGVGK